MPIFSRAGMAPISLAEYIAELRASFQAGLGADMSTAADAPQTQIIGALALELARYDEAAIAAAAGMSLWQASGSQLDDWGALLNIPRRPATHSTARLTLGGRQGTHIPAGSRAQTAAGALFETTQHVLIIPGDVVNVEARAVEPGAIIADAGAISTVVDVVPGWLTVTNAAAATPGREPESDLQYRRRYLLATAHAGQDSAEAVRSRLLATDSVIAAVVHDNTDAATLTLQGMDILPYSLAAIVQGGADVDIATAIAASKPLGIPTTGAVLSNAADARATPIRFTRAVPEPVRLRLETRIGPGFPTDGVYQIQQRVAAWAAGQWASAPGDFDTSGLDIGEDVNVFRLYSPINSVPGHVLQSLAVTDAAGSALPAVTPLATRYTIAPPDVTVTIS